MNKITNLVLLALLFSNYATGTTTLKVGIMEADRPPYFFMAKGKYQGIYIDLLHAIEQQTDIKFELLPYPQARLRALMLSDRLDVEPGIDMSWRDGVSERLNSVYSLPFMQSRESWVMRNSNKGVFTVQNITEQLNPCSVLGFDDIDEIKASNTDIDVNSDKYLLDLIIKNRCDIAIIPDLILEYFNVYQDSRFHIIPLLNHYELRLRLTKRFEYLLPKINDVILQMQATKELKTIINKYSAKVKSESK